MSNRSRLSDEQWLQIEAALLAGETVLALSARFAISESAIRKRMRGRLTVMRAQCAWPDDVEPPRSLAGQLRAVSRHLALAAAFGSATAHRLAELAHDQAGLLGDPAGAPPDQVKRTLALIAGANEAARIGLNLLNAKKEVVGEDDEPTRCGLGHFYGETDP
ncbi:hypothetical protein GALL_207590 [mine drainage metagenome]|uniref:Uncharacterized protein n=1 Tax=mine drainage metagenome TaxID=410659 RepID=A0A1J5SAD7_9ZZZZ